jgi:hypothetical protein
MEKDDEVKGEGNSVNYEYRMHDTRLGRFFAVDPISHEFPWNSPYAFSENRLLDAVELEGLEAKIIITGEGANNAITAALENGDHNEAISLAWSALKLTMKGKGDYATFIPDRSGGLEIYNSNNELILIVSSEEVFDEPIFIKQLNEEKEKLSAEIKTIQTDITNLKETIKLNKEIYKDAEKQHKSIEDKMDLQTNAAKGDPETRESSLGLDAGIGVHHATMHAENLAHQTKRMKTSLNKVKRAEHNLSIKESKLKHLNSKLNVVESELEQLNN